MGVRIVSAQVSAAGDEFEVVVEGETRADLLDRSVYEMVIKEAAKAGFGLNCAISRTPNMYPVDEEGTPLTYPDPGRTKILFRRLIACTSRI